MEKELYFFTYQTECPFHRCSRFIIRPVSTEGAWGVTPPSKNNFMAKTKSFSPSRVAESANFQTFPQIQDGSPTLSANGTWKPPLEHNSEQQACSSLIWKDKKSCEICRLRSFATFRFFRYSGILI